MSVEGLGLDARPERGRYLVAMITVLAIAQGVLGALRAFEFVRFGTDVAGRGVLLLPIIGSLMIARGILVAVIATLYGAFAWGALRRKAWAWPVGMLVAVVNGLLVVPVLIIEGGATATLLWAVVPVVILVYLLTPAGRQAFLTAR